MANGIQDKSYGCQKFWRDDKRLWYRMYLTIMPRARMGYWFRAHQGEGNNCFSKIQLVGQKNIETKHLSLVKAIILVFKASAFRY